MLPLYVGNLQVTKNSRGRECDHYPLLLEFRADSHQFSFSFKFLKMWSLHKDCKDLISDSWKDGVIGKPMFVLSTKLKRLKLKLKIWNKEVFGNIHTYVNDAENELSNIQAQIQSIGHTDQLMAEEKKAQSNLDEALLKQESFWQEKARIRWHMDGYRNSRYFHRLTQIKNKTKMISSIKNDEELISDPQRMSDYIVNYYNCIFSSSNTVLQDQFLVEEVIPKLIDDTTNNLLIMIPSLDEVKKVIFDLNQDGAPGPYGFGASFFQCYWDIIQQDVYEAVLEFFHTSWLPPDFNANTLVLIPKISNADRIEHYRPIALANFKLKILSKVLADRLAAILPSIIYKVQRGFVKGRNIKDCIILTSDAINVLDKKCFGGNLALKIDVSKAFDTLNLNFLFQVLQQFGCHQTFINWICSILHSAKISISINGAQNGYFSCNRGVRQGDPLSPLLFCIAEEVLSRGIGKLVDDGLVEKISASRNQLIPSHCFYADDLMVFCKEKIFGLQALKDLCTRYANCSGQHINVNKSSIYAGGISSSRMSHGAEVRFFCWNSPIYLSWAPYFQR